MIWDRFHDVESNCSNQVKNWDKKSAPRFVTQLSKAIVLSVLTEAIVPSSNKLMIRGGMLTTFTF
jgi:hypothetical protein